MRTKMRYNLRGKGKSKNKNHGFYYLYLEAVSIINSKSHSVHEDSQASNAKARPTELFDLVSFSSKGLEFIVKFSEEHSLNLFQQILHSICPSSRKFRSFIPRSSIYFADHEPIEGEEATKNDVYSPIDDATGI